MVVGNVSQDKYDLAGLIFHAVFVLFLLSVLFFLIPQTAFFITLGPFLIIPLLLPVKSLKWRFFVFLVLAIPFMFLNGMLVSYVDAGGLVIFYLPIPVLFAIVISHYILRFVKERASNIIKVMGIITLIILIILFVILSAIKVNKVLTDHANYNLLNDILCKGAYTTTSPTEIKSLCDKVRVGGYQEDYWIELKSYCQGLVEEIESDKYYFDYYDYPANKFGIRNPSNYKNCAEPERELRDFKINQNSVEYEFPDYTGIQRPEVLDPNLCDELADEQGESLQEYFKPSRPGHVADNCYSRTAIGTGEVSLCEKTQFPHQCYSYVARERNDPTICENIDPDFAARYPSSKQNCLELKG